LAATLTVTVIGGSFEPDDKASFRVHVLPPLGQVHPSPAMDIKVIPAGTESVTVTLPCVAPAAAQSVT
jgi:hypothetical protein